MTNRLFPCHASVEVVNPYRISYDSDMKTVSIDALKRNLASMVDEAARGTHIVITRYGKPVAALTKPGIDHLHIGARAERARLRPVLQKGTKGAYLEVLADDRGSMSGRIA